MTDQNGAAQAAHIEALQDLRVGVHMDRHNLDDGDAKLAALDAAISLLRAPVANSMPIRLSAEVLEYLKEGIESATGCEESDVDYDFANELLRLINGPIYAAPQASAAITHYECGPHNGDGTYEAVPVCSAPQANEAVRIVFPTHLRKMWSSGEVQAWLDEHQGVTAPKASAKGSMERYRKWQAEQAGARNAGIELAAAWVDKRRQGFDHAHGYMESDTGTWSFGRGDGATAKEEYSAELAEIAESLRALKTQVEKEGGDCAKGESDA